jgi:diacylglycerol kinase (ATP)
VRVTLIHNPNAGDEAHSRSELCATLADAGHDVRYHSIKADGWKEALHGPTDLVAVAGGDGTVRRVVKELAGSDVPLTLLPLGTANNIARTLGFRDAAVAELARAWPRASKLALDVGKVDSTSGGTQFVEAVGGGLFADLLARAEEADDDANDADEDLERGLRLLLEAITDARARPWTLELDGTDVSDDLLAVEALNVGESGPRIPLAPGADPSDGKLEVVLVRPDAAGSLAAHVEARLEQRAPEPPQLEVLRGRSLRMEFPDGCPVRVDDRLWGDDGESAVVSVGDLRVDVLVPYLGTASSL